MGNGFSEATFWKACVPSWQVVLSLAQLCLGTVPCQTPCCQKIYKMCKLFFLKFARCLCLDPRAAPPVG